MTIGERIYYCRTEKHMTQKQLGEKAGIDPSTIRKYESGRLNPKIETVEKIANALGVFLTDLYPEEQRPAIELKSMQNFFDGFDIRKSELRFENDKVKAEFYIGQLNECGQEVAFQTALAVFDQCLKHNSYLKFRHLLKLFKEGPIKEIADKVEGLAQVPAYLRQDSDLFPSSAGSSDEEPIRAPTHQSAQNAPQDAPAGSGDKEPVQK